jgi:hypothetical protein
VLTNAHLGYHPGVRSEEAEQGMRVSVSAESVGVRGSGRASITQHHYMLRAEDFT